MDGRTDAGLGYFMGDDLDDLFEARTPPPRPAFVAPAAAPNGTQYQRAQFFLENRDVSPGSLRKWWVDLTPTDRAAVCEQFKKTAEYERAKAVCDHWLDGGRDPLVMLIWARKMADKLGFVG